MSGHANKKYRTLCFLSWAVAVLLPVVVIGFFMTSLPPFTERVSAPIQITESTRSNIRLYPSARPVRPPLRPTFVDASGNLDLYAPTSTVLVVWSQSRPKAFPLSVIDIHEVVVARHGSMPMLVTYCGLTYAAAAYTSTSGIDVSRMRDSGYIYESGLVLRDEATQSLWLQLTGECFVGTLIGHRLEEVKSQLATLHSAVETIPGLLLMMPPDGNSSAYTNVLSPYSGPMNPAGGLLFPVTHLDTSLAAIEPVVCFMLGQQSVAFPVEIVSEEETVFRIGAASFRATSWLGFPKVEMLEEGGLWRSLQTRVCYWFAWKTIHPETALIRPDP